MRSHEKFTDDVTYQEREDDAYKIQELNKQKDAAEHKLDVFRAAAEQVCSIPVPLYQSLYTSPSIHVPLYMSLYT